MGAPGDLQLTMRDAVGQPGAERPRACQGLENNQDACEVGIKWGQISDYKTSRRTPFPQLMPMISSPPVARVGFWPWPWTWSSAWRWRLCRSGNWSCWSCSWMPFRCSCLKLPIRSARRHTRREDLLGMRWESRRGRPRALLALTKSPITRYNTGFGELPCTSRN